MVGLVHHSPGKMTAYVEHCGAEIHKRVCVFLFLCVGKLMFDHFGFEKPSSTSNVDAITFNELGLVAYGAEAEIV